MGPVPQEVGCRVRIIKDFATVRYVGPVAKQDGVWVGVEWDDPTRGKHDGSTAGVKYFECRSGHPTAGSFVRLEKVHFGATVLEALLARYQNKTAEFGQEVRDNELYVTTARHRRVFVELVGQDKIEKQQSQVQLLTSARLVGLDVAAVGDGEALQAAVPQLSELDLTANLVSSWAFAQQLCTALPRLEVLNLSENRMALPPLQPKLQLGPGDGGALPLRALVLNDCGISWQQFLAVEPSLPRLQELHISGNSIASLEDPLAAAAAADAPAATAGLGPAAAAGQTQEQAAAAVADPGAAEAAAAAAAAYASPLPASRLRALQILNLEDNGLASWQEVARLAQLPALTKLHLTGNPIPEVLYPLPPQPAPPPPAPSQPAPPTSAEASSAPAQQPAAAAVGAAAEPAGRAPGAARAGAGAAAEPAQGPGQGSCEGEGGGAPFAALAALYMGGCALGSWSSVDALARFPALRELRLTGNPLLLHAKGGGRYEVIGRVAGLRQLNGAEVRPRERRDSELRYLQHIAAEMEGAGQDVARRGAVRGAHPRLRYLMETYGQVLATAAKSATAGGNLAASTVELKLTCVAAVAHAKMGTQVKRLPRSTTIASLRLLCEKLFKVKADQQALFLRGPGEPVPEEIGEDEEDRPISFFGVQDGHEFLVDELDMEARARAGEEARTAGAAAQQARAATQLREGDRLQAEFARSMGLPPGSKP